MMFSFIVLSLCLIEVQRIQCFRLHSKCAHIIERQGDLELSFGPFCVYLRFL